MTIPTPEFLNIVAEATKRANGRSFDEVDVLDKDGNETTMKEEDFFNLFTDTFMNRRVMDEEVSKSDNPLITTRSMAFSLNAINNINMAGKVKWHIDDIVNHLDSDTIRKYGETVYGHPVRDKEARDNFRRSLKEYVDKQYEVEAKSPAAKSLVSELKRVYDRDYADTNATRDPDRFLKDGLVFIHMVNDATDSKAMENGGDLALKKVNENEYVSVWSIGRVLLDGLETAEERYDVAMDLSLSAERNYDVDIKFGDLNGIKLSDFYSKSSSDIFSGSLSQEQLDWAFQTVEDMRAKIFGDESLAPLKNFMVNGEPMFDKTEYRKTPAELSSKVIKSMLEGKIVSVKNEKNGLIVDLEPKLIQQDKEKGFFEKIYEAIAEFFNFDSAKEKRFEQSEVQNYQENIDNKEKNNAAARKRLSFYDLLNTNDAKRTVPPPSSSREKSKGKEM
ncbi:MAG: hypothetical protein MSH49_06065 [[Eubacterium] saphenum]|nr:hypothetical protein [[Eubacterium] saphenum]